MKRLFPPAEGTAERDGWEKFLDTPQPEKQLSQILAILNGKEPGNKAFCRGWLDALESSN